MYDSNTDIIDTVKRITGKTDIHTLDWAFISHPGPKTTGTGPSNRYDIPAGSVRYNLGQGENKQF
ncbi:MAG: hypothetical protein HUJ56_07490 [Erysipelotrichaceae bacterium]|nr:hypothetical protein [Erysipelotrichaceae bacterium]